MHSSLSIYQRTHGSTSLSTCGIDNKFPQGTVCWLETPFTSPFCSCYKLFPFFLQLWSDRTFIGNVPGSLESWLLLRSLRTLHLVAAGESLDSTHCITFTFNKEVFTSGSLVEVELWDAGSTSSEVGSGAKGVEQK